MKEKKKYQLENSPLFSLKSKKKLASILFLTIEELRSLAIDDSYNVYFKKVKGKKRLIEEPNGLRKKVHKRLQNLLSRIITPDYLFSGKKGLSFVDNANSHSKNDYFLLVDIKNFYPNSNIEYIFRFFHYVLKMSEDVAWLLSEIVTISEHIPTGSPLSQLLAYFSYSTLFNKINKISLENNIKFSLYVDDMTFSSNVPIPKNFHVFINFLLKNVGHYLKRKKTKYYSKKHYKKVTGTIITPSHSLAIPNNKQKRIFTLKTESKNINDIPADKLFSLIGLLRYARQVDPSFYPEFYKKLSLQEKIINKKITYKA